MCSLVGSGYMCICLFIISIAHGIQTNTTFVDDCIKFSHHNEFIELLKSIKC